MSHRTQSKGREEHKHPVEYEWYERGDYEAQVNCEVRCEGKPTLLGIFGNGFTLGLFRGCNGTTGVFTPNTNTKEEPNTQRRRSK